MQFDKSDIPVVIMFMIALCISLYQTYDYNNKITAEIKELKDFSYSVVIRQVEIVEEQEKIRLGIDSLRYIYLRK